MKGQRATMVDNVDRSLANYQKTARRIVSVIQKTVVHPLSYEDDPDWSQVVLALGEASQQLAHFQGDVVRSSFINYLFQPTALPANVADLEYLLSSRPMSTDFISRQQRLGQEAQQGEKKVSEKEIDRWNDDIDKVVLRLNSYRDTLERRNANR